MEAIKEFQGEYHWLSNFYPCQVMWMGNPYPTVENAYQAAKSQEPWYLNKMMACSPGESKKLSREVPLPPDWEDRKVDIMLFLVRQKMSSEPFRSWLLDTGDRPIYEGNTWGDNFWGVDLKTGQGKNILGQIIMDIRGTLQGADSQHAKVESAQ